MFELQSEARRKAFKTKDRRDYVLCLISNLELCKQNVAEFKRIDKVLLKLILAGSDAFSVAVKMRERVKDLLYEHRWFVIDYKDEVEMESNHQ